MRILGIRVDEYKMDSALALIQGWLEQFSGALGTVKQVITLNAEGIMIAREDAGFASLVENADLVTPDGSGVVWAAGRYGNPGISRLAGIDLLERLCAQAAVKGQTVYLLGAQPGIAAQAGEKLQQRYPGLVVAGTENGYFRDREPQVLAALNQAAPDLLFLGLGMPFQEKWLAAHKAELQVGVAIGVGGSFDVISGNLRRAPLWMQKLRLEWLYRLLQQPSRWRRFLALPRFMAAVGKDAKRKPQG